MTNETIALAAGGKLERRRELARARERPAHELLVRSR